MTARRASENKLSNSLSKSHGAMDVRRKRSQTCLCQKSRAPNHTFKPRRSIPGLSVLFGMEWNGMEWTEWNGKGAQVRRPDTAAGSIRFHHFTPLRNAAAVCFHLKIEFCASGCPQHSRAGPVGVGHHQRHSASLAARSGDMVAKQPVEHLMTQD